MDILAPILGMLIMFGHQDELRIVTEAQLAEMKHKWAQEEALKRKQEAQRRAELRIRQLAVRPYRLETFEVTAYTAYCEGCSGTTYTGINLRTHPNARVAAVDPNIIPLGTKLIIPGYGEVVAADTGGAIKGHRIDLFIPTYEEAVRWGRKTLRVKILDQ